MLSIKRGNLCFQSKVNNLDTNRKPQVKEKVICQNTNLKCILNYLYAYLSQNKSRDDREGSRDACFNDFCTCLYIFLRKVSSLGTDYTSCGTDRIGGSRFDMYASLDRMATVGYFQGLSWPFPRPQLQPAAVADSGQLRTGTKFGLVSTVCANWLPGWLESLSKLRDCLGGTVTISTNFGLGHWLHKLAAGMAGAFFQNVTALRMRVLI